MLSGSDPLLPLLLAALRAAWRGGQEILRVYGTDFAVETKSDATPLTEADRGSQQRIRETLAAADPSIPFLGEEGSEIPYEERRDWPRFWLVDPLDGTKEFVSRNGEFTVNIALIEGVKPVLGVILAPLLSLVYFGLTAAGAAFRLDDAGALAAADSIGWDDVAGRALPLPRARTSVFTVAASRSHMTPATEAYIGECRRLFGRGRRAQVGQLAQDVPGGRGAHRRVPAHRPHFGVGCGCRAGDRRGRRRRSLRARAPASPWSTTSPSCAIRPFVCATARYRDSVPSGLIAPLAPRSSARQRGGAAPAQPARPDGPAGASNSASIAAASGVRV